MDDLLSKLSVADSPQVTEISPELRSERKIGSEGSGTVFKESWNNRDIFTEKTKISPSDRQSERKISSGGFESVFKGSLNIAEAFTEISSSELEFERKIGSGGFGIVFKGSWNKAEVAIKVFKLEGSIRPRQAAIQKEAETWAKLHHPHVLHFLGADIKGDIPFFVMPYLENGNARDFIERHPEFNRNKILYHVTLALVYLHGRNVVHGDIKGFNVLIDSASNAVLCDFGIALIKDDVSSTSLNSGQRSIAGTPSFMPPERLKGGSLRKPCDVYAFGMLIYEVHANTNPLNLHIGYSDFLKLVAIEGHRPERPDRDEAPQMTDDIWSLAERCWESTAAARPFINDVCNIIAPSVKLYDNHPANAVPRDGGPKRPDKGEASQLPDDTPLSTDRTRVARPPIDDVYDDIAPSTKLYRDFPAKTLPRSGGPSTHVPKFPRSAYDRLRAGATFREALVIRTPYKHLWAVAMTYDCGTIASSGIQEGDKDEGFIQIWDSRSGARRRSLQGHTAYVSCLSFFKNGLLVSGSWDCTVRVWDLESSAMVILKHDDIITCISLSTDDNTIATRVWHGSIRLWDATAGRLRLMHILEDPECQGITSISISSDSSFLVAFEYHVSREDHWWVATRWKQLHDGKWAIDVRRKIECHFKGHVISSSCSSSGSRVALSDDDHLSIYGVHGKESYETHIDEGGGKVIFSPDGNWLVGRANYKTGGRTRTLRKRSLKIWDATSGKMLSELLSDRYTDVDVVFISHDGSTILAGDGSSLRIFALTDV